MKRQRGRNRGGGGSGGGGGGGGKPQQNANRAFDSNGPENIKVRGNAQHVFEKYQQLARDAQTAGDRVLGENYLQHAEHYFRLLRAMQPQRPASEILGRDQFASGYDIDFEDEAGQAQAMAADAEAAAAEAASADGEGETEPRADRDGWRARDERPRDERPRDDRPPREDRWREDRPRGDRDERPREDRPRDDRPRDERPRDDRPRGDQPRRDRWRDDRPRGDREPRAERDPLAVVEPESTPLPSAEDRGGPVLRDADGGESHAPAFLQSRPVPAAATEAEPAPRPRRRRAPRTFEGGEGAPPSTETEEA